MNAQSATPKQSLSLRATVGALFSGMLRLMSNLPPNQRVRDFRHLEITRRVWNAPSLIHTRIYGLLLSDPAFMQALPDASVPYLLRVVVGEDEIRANLYRTQVERGMPVFDHDYYQNGEVSFLVNSDQTISPLLREQPGLYFNIYEPEISYVRVLDEEELDYVRISSSPYLLPIEPLARKHITPTSA
jgi:hypothetical protein